MLVEGFFPYLTKDRFITFLVDAIDHREGRRREGRGELDVPLLD
jgi:hypothetical protein